MNQRHLWLMGTAVAVCGLTGDWVMGAAGPWPTPPQHARMAASVGNFGHERVDEYAWMRPRDWQAVLRDPSTLDTPIAAAVQAENAYAEAMLAPAAALRAKLRLRSDALDRINDSRLEVEDGEFFYYTRKSSTGGQIAHVRRPINGGVEQVLLDVGVEAAAKPSFSLHWGGPQRSPDGKLFGWAQDLTGSGIFQIRVREIATGRLLVSDIDNAHGGMAFDSGGRYLYWVGRSTDGNANAVWRRDMRTGKDVRLHYEGDDAFFIELRTLSSGAFVLFRMLNGSQTEAWLIPAGGEAAPILIEKRAADLRYDVEHWNGQLVILTDADGATDQKLMTAPLATPGKAHWKPLLPHVRGRFIAAIHPFRDHLVREEWRDALPRLVVMGKDGTEHDVAFDEAAYAITVPPGQGWKASALAFTYQSPRLPKRSYELHLASGRAVSKEAGRSTSSYDAERYVVERITARASDGALIPITLLRSRASKRDSSSPLFLYGYGSYGASVHADFRPPALALVDEGWIYAIAHVRGGAERGTEWWRSVLRKGKKTTFTDFITCAEHLIAERYTASGRIVAHGYSAGGLLMGAAYTMRPDLWAGVIAQVPFVDPLNTMDYFESHPLGTTALPIWGDPRIPDEYAYIASYSPYDNLGATAYPALLATGNIADERVSFFEPLKFAVKARQLTTAGNPVLVKIDAVGGHVFPAGSAADRDQQAMFGAFAIWAADRKWGAVQQR